MLALPTPLMILLAASPLIAVLFLMAGRRWPGSRAGPAGWLLATVVALLFFGADFTLLLVAWSKAILLAFFVLYIIWMALLLYHTVNEAGVIAAIGRQMPGIAADRPAQALLLAWIFGSFLQGATGFGVPAAVVAPLLAGLGFGANIAVAAALLGHGWAVTYGSLGSSFISLIAATGVSGDLLAGPSAALLWVCCFCCGIGILWLAGRWQALRSRLFFVLVLTMTMGGAQWALAVSGLWTVAALGAGLVGLAVGITYLLLSSRRQGSAPPADAVFNPRDLMSAFWPYIILIAVVLVGQLLLFDQLNAIRIDPTFPQVCTSRDYCTPAGQGRAISVFGHGGALLIYASLLIFLWYRWQGPLETAPATHYRARPILSKTLRGVIKPTIGVYSLVAMALTMEHAGMTQLVAQVLAGTGIFYPFLSPFLGALGAFMTGSNTNSNVVFGQLQLQTSLSLDLSVALILAAQTAGAAIASSLAPAKVLVGSSTVENANDGQVLRLLAPICVAIIAFIGLIVWVISKSF